MAKRSSERHARAALLPLLLASAGLGGCTQLDNALASVPFLSFMRNSPALDPYEAPRPAPPGAVPYESPVGELLPPMEGTDAALTAFAASSQGTSPLAANDPAALALGQVMYDRHCSVCHGTDGRGNGPVTGEGKFPAGLVPNLAAGAALGRPDGYVYAIIRAGRGLMPSYGARISHIERWAIVAYVNQLQSAAGATAPAAAPAVDTVAPPPAPAPAAAGDSVPANAGQENRQ
ncbi:MAG TPA: cytochrome c [Longimicrobiales bacterium]|nr:cytochrome c [Longimicrobiales bacterium]